MFSINRIQLLVALLLFAALAALWPAMRPVTAQTMNPVVTVSAANYSANITPGMIVAGFGVNLATTTQPATTIPLPTTLNGTSIEVTDSNGAKRAAALFFISPGQINFQIPSATALGTATVTVLSGTSAIAQGTIEVLSRAPVIFTADASGTGFPAGSALRVTSAGQLIYEPLAIFDSGQNKFVAKPIDLTSHNDPVYLVLYLSGGGNANASNIRVLIGGQSLTPDYFGPQGGFVGLDQLNILVPRSLIGSGQLSLSVAVPDEIVSNSTQIEVSAAAVQPGSSVQINGFSTTTVLAGSEVFINGSGFAGNTTDNLVSFLDDEAQAATAQLMSASSSQLRVRVPFGAGTGKIKVRSQGEDAISQTTMNVRTSISGFIENTGLQPIAGATMKVVGTNITTTSNADGSFVLPDVQTGAALIEVDGATATANPPFPKITLKMPVKANRDNQFNSPVTMQQANGASATVGGSSPAEGFSLSVATTRRQESAEAADSPDEINASALLQTGNVIFDLPTGNTILFPDGSSSGTITLTQIENGRVPAKLPPSVFSSTIVQLTPFGTKFAPGGKLSFPNVDTFGFKSGLQPRLFKLDQNANSATRGTFIDAGPVTLSADGQRLETAANAITEATIYLVSFARPTATAIGYVTEYDGQPVRRAIVRARGQATFTDNNGGFVLSGIPVLSSSDLLTIEVSYQRPDGRVDRTKRSGIAITAGTLAQITPDLVLPAPTTNRAPLAFGLSRLTLTEGETRDFDFGAGDPDAGQTIQVTTSNVNFASIINKGGGTYSLRLAPAVGTTGEFVPVITVTDNQGSSRGYKIPLTVYKSDKSLPVAQSATVITNEDTAVNFTLSSTDPTGKGLTYNILSQPKSGTLSGKAPNLTYTPSANFNGTDSFTWEAVTTTGIKTQFVYTNFAILPVNDAPVLTNPGSKSINAGQPLNLTLLGADPDTIQRLTLSVNGLPPGASFVATTATSAQLNWTPTFEQIGSYPISVTLADDGSPALNSTINFTVSVDAKWSKTSGPTGGAVRAMASLGYDVYAGTDGGGVFWSSTAGKSWVPLNSGLGNLYITALAFHGKTLLAGTEGSGIFYYNGKSWTALSKGLPTSSVITSIVSNGTTMLVSAYPKGASNVMSVYSIDDFAGTWAKVGADFPSKTIIYELAYAGTTPIAATSTDVYFYTGKLPAWTKAPISDKGTTLVYSVAVGGNTIFAGSSNAVYSTTDSGATWKTYGTGISGNVRSLLVYTSKTGTTLNAATTVGVYETSSGTTWMNLGIPVNSAINDLTGPTGSLLAGTQGAGVYGYTDGFLRAGFWYEANNGLNSTRLTSIAELGGTLYAATGKITFNDSPHNTGIFLSSDGGQSWKPANNGLQDLNVNKVGVAGKTLFACTTAGGLFRSFDGGATWVESNKGVPINSAFPGTPYYEINAFLNYEKAGTLFLGTSNGGVVRSTDGGENWVAVNSGLPFSTLFVTSFALKGSTVFAGTNGGSGVYALDAKTATWTAAATGLPASARVSTVAANSSFVFAGTFDILRNGLGLYRSTDGSSWQSASSGIPSGAFIYSIVPKGNDLFSSTSAGVFYSSDQGSTWRALNSALGNLNVTTLFATGNALYAGTDGAGVYSLLNSGQVWSDVNTGLSNQFVNTIVTSGNTYYAGTLGSGVFRSLDQGLNWSSASSGLPATANVQAIAISGVNLYAGTFGDGVYRSTNSGNSWTQSNTGLTNLFINDVAVNGSTVFAATDGGVFRSTDSGANWSAANTGIANVRVLSLLINGANLYAGTDGDGVYLSTNNGGNWTKISTGLPNSALNVSTLRFHGTTLFAGTLSGGIYRSTNNGTSWTAANTGIPATAAIFSFVSYGAKLFAATAYGVYVTEDNAATWKQSNAGLLDIYATSLSVSGTNLVAGTKTSGVYKQAMQ